MTFVSSGGVKQCISTRNGTIFYPHGVGSPSSCGLVVGHEECDDGNPDPGDGCTSLITSATGAPVERFDCDDACKPVFLTADGVPTSSTSSSIGLRWLSPACAWEPEIGMFACPSGIYSPDLGSPVSYQKAPGKSVKKELTNIY
jgi:cysteine-rich repeat protein